jgi:hypothetical protein
VGRVSPLKAFRHYVNLSRTEKRFASLLRDFRFSTARHVLEYGQSQAPLKSLIPQEPPALKAEAA